MLEHTSIAISNIICTWGRRFKTASQINGLWSLDAFNNNNQLTDATTNIEDKEQHEIYFIE